MEAADPRFAKGIEEFNRGLFFESHETWEAIWLEERGDDRPFYQGMIQIAAGYFKYTQGVPAGAIKLWRAGLEKIERYGPAHLGIDVACFARSVRENLRQLEAVQSRGIAGCPLEIPLLQRVV